MEKTPETDPWYFSVDEDKEKTYSLSTSVDLDPLLDKIGDAHYVLLGEASHGTHEYYTWRAEISKRLIIEKGFNFIAVEGDWPDCYKVNRYIKGLDDRDKSPVEVLNSFNRWPTWMWANWEIVSFITWLKDYNSTLPSTKKIGFYGLDVYSLWESMEALVKYLDAADPEVAKLARKAIKCFEPFGEDGQLYARAHYSLPHSCQDTVANLLKDIRMKALAYNHDPEAALNTEQNATIAVNAEAYYRNMLSFDDSAWNLRDTHMVDTLNRIFQFHGLGTRGIVWAHNTHVGDASCTDMAKAAIINVGQLVREQQKQKDVILIGFGSYQGTVIAGKAWEAPMEVMNVPKARMGSIEDVLRKESAEDKLLIFDSNNRKERFRDSLFHRAIGVVYLPENEKYGNYVPSIVNSRYDAFIYIDRTHALHPLHIKPDGHKTPETYPFNF